MQTLRTSLKHHHTCIHERKRWAEDQGEVLTVEITNEEVPVSHDYLLVCVVLNLCPSYVTLGVVIVVV